MARFLTTLLVFGLVASLAQADDKLPSPADPVAKALDSLMQEFTAAQNKFADQVRASQEAAKERGLPPKPVRFEDRDRKSVV